MFFVFCDSAKLVSENTWRRKLEECQGNSMLSQRAWAHHTDHTHDPAPTAQTQQSRAGTSHFGSRLVLFRPWFRRKTSFLRCLLPPSVANAGSGLSPRGTEPSARLNNSAKPHSCPNHITFLCHAMQGPSFFASTLANVR